MSPSADLLHRVRERLVPVARFVPAELGPARLRHLSRDGRVAAAHQLMRTEPRTALARLEAELDADSPASLVRSTALAAWHCQRNARAAELFAQLDAETRTSLPDSLKWARSARKLEDPEALPQAQRAVRRHLPRTDAMLDRCVNALRRSRIEDLPAIRRWRDLVATKRPELDTTALDHLVLRLEVDEALAEERLDPAVRADLLTREGGAPTLVRGLLRSRRLDDLTDLVAAVDDAASAEVGERLWRLVALRAAASGWTVLAADATEHLARHAVEEPVDAEQIRRLRSDADDEQALLATPWQPPTAVPRAPAAAVDERSVVSVLGQSLPLRSGGYATRSHGILTGLADQGWDVAAVTRLGFPFDLWWRADDERTPAPVDVVDGIPYHRLLTDGVRHYPRAPLPPYVEEGARGIVDLARDRRAGLVHASSLYDVGMAGLSAARQLGLPFVYEMRGLKQLLEDARQPLFSESPRRTYLDQLEGTVARSADALLVITEALGREMIGLGVDPDRITVVPNGVDASRFTPRERDEALAERLGLTGTTVIGYVGGLVHYEGLDLLFRAAAQMREHRQDFHVLVVGDGAHQRTLHALVEELDLGDLVTFTGRIPHEDVEDYLSLVDITPFPRKPLKVCELISPIKPFEAMAMRKTVVASDVAALAEIVEDGVTGRLFAKGDPDDLARVLEELIDAPEERSRLGDAARTWVVEERDWRRIVGVVDGVYRDLLGVGTLS